MKVYKYEVIKRLKLTEEASECGVGTNNQRLKGYGNHWHDFYEIEVVAEGEGRFWLNGMEHRRKKGNITLLTPADFHMMTSQEPVNLINIEIGSSWLSETMRAMLASPEFVKVRQLGEEELAQMISAIDLLIKEYENNGPCIGQLLEYVFSRFIQRKQSKASENSGKEYISGIIKAVAYIEQHFREHITLEILSQISGYHPTYFSKMFRKVTGENYIERLTTLRINYAKMLLKRGVAVSETCFASGFGSVSNFVAVFKKRCGMTPSAYRDQVKK